MKDFYIWLGNYLLISSESSVMCEKLDIGCREKNFQKIFFKDFDSNSNYKNVIEDNNGKITLWGFKISVDESTPCWIF